jgi:hypothetical protein
MGCQDAPEHMSSPEFKYVHDNIILAATWVQTVNLEVKISEHKELNPGQSLDESNAIAVGRTNHFLNSYSGAQNHPMQKSPILSL